MSGKKKLTFPSNKSWRSGRGCVDSVDQAEHVTGLCTCVYAVTALISMWVKF